LSSPHCLHVEHADHVDGRLAVGRAHPAAEVQADVVQVEKRVVGVRVAVGREEALRLREAVEVLVEGILDQLEASLGAGAASAIAARISGGICSGIGFERRCDRCSQSMHKKRQRRAGQKVQTN